MERIKKALQRAHSENDQRLDANAHRRERPLPRVGPFRIEYEHTRVINVSEKVLLKNRVVAGLQGHQAASAYKVLRVEVLRRMQAHGWNTLAITSAGPMEGKSLTTLNLAISIAQEFSNTVLVVEADFCRPTIASLFDYQPAQGLTDHLLKGVPLSEVLFNPGIERLVVLPSGSSLNGSSELLHSPEMRDFTEELKTRYKGRLILFDLPPLLVGADALSFLSNVECVLLVVEDGKTHCEKVVRAKELLSEFHVVGSVLNKSKKAEVNRYYEYY